MNRRPLPYHGSALPTELRRRRYRPILGIEAGPVGYRDSMAQTAIEYDASPYVPEGLPALRAGDPDRLRRGFLSRAREERAHGEFRADLTMVAETLNDTRA